MRQLWALVIAVAVAGGLAPSPVSAHGFPRGSAGVVVTGPSPAPVTVGPTFVHRGFPSAIRKSVFAKPVDPWKFWPPKVVPRRHRFGHLHSFASPFIGAPSLVVTTPPVVDGYRTPLFTYAPAPLVAVPAPAVLPTPTVIDYPTGWYQLRGDGVTSPYTWVWIPKPPAPPAPEAAPPSPMPEPSAPAPPAERRPAYHWTDERGVTTWTNRLDRVPERFRDEAAASAEPE